MYEFLGILQLLVRIYVYVIIAVAIMSWLIGFGIVNFNNPQVRQVWKGLNTLTEPALAPIRRRLPQTSGIDFSTIVLIILCYIAISLLAHLQNNLA